MTSAPSRRSRRRWIAATVAVTVAATLYWYAVNPPLSVNEKRFVGYWRLSIDGDPQHDVQFQRDRTISIRSQGKPAFDDQAAIWSVHDSQLTSRPFDMTLKDRFDLFVRGLSLGRIQLGGWDERYGFQFVSNDRFVLWDDGAPNNRTMFDRINESTPSLQDNEERNAESVQ